MIVYFYFFGVLNVKTYLETRARSFREQRCVNGGQRFLIDAFQIVSNETVEVSVGKNRQWKRSLLIDLTF